MPPHFLFVNKDAGSASLTRSSASEQTSINSHVQRGRRHKRSVPSAGRSGNKSRKPAVRENSESSSDLSGVGGDVSQPDTLESATPKNDRATPIRSTLPTRPHLPGKTSGRSSSTRGTDAKNSKSQKSKSCSTPTTDRKATVLLNTPVNRPSPRDISQVTSTSLDPFGQSVVKLDPHVAKLCRYFCDNFHPSVWHAESWTSPEGSYTYQTSAVEVVRRAMQSEVEMNAMLACMAARIENVDMIPGQGTDKYMGQALMAVRRRFSSAPKHQLLLIVFHLYAGEAYRQNYQAAKIHMQAAKALFDSWGGLDYIPDPALKELFIIGDGHMSAVLLEPCSLPCEYDPGPYWTVTPPLLQLAPPQDLGSIAPVLQSLGRTGYFPAELVQAIQETTECTWVLHYAPLGATDLSKHAARWLQWRHAAIRYRLLAVKFPDLIHDAVRIALVMWILTSMVMLGLKRLGSLIAPKLQDILRRSSDQSDEQWKHLAMLKMWVLTVGAMCSTAGSDTEQWYVERLFEIGLVKNIHRFQEAHVGTDTVDVLRNFQEKFFYYHPIQKPRLERLARLLGGGPSETPTSASHSSPSEPGRTSRSPS